MQVYCRQKLEENQKTLLFSFPAKKLSHCTQLVLDDFEKNLVGIDKGDFVVRADAFPVLEALLRFLPYSGDDPAYHNQSLYVSSHI